MPTRNILPCYDNEGAVGNSSKTWAEGRFYDLYCKGTPWIDVRIYGETTGFALAVAAIGSTSSVLYIPNEQSVTGDVTVPATLTLKFSPGGFLNIATTKTATINGNIEAGLTKIFSCAGTGKVVLNKVKEVYPEWWGAKGDGNDWSLPIGSATDCSSAIKAAVASVTGVKIVFSNGIYMASECIYLKAGTHLSFSRSAWILGNHAGPSIISLKGASECLLENPQVMGHITTYPKTGIALGRTVALPASTRNAIYNPYVVGYFSQAGFYSIAAEETSFYTPRTDIRGGGAKYCFFTSDTDELSIDGFQTNSNTIVDVYAYHFVNEQNGLTGGAGIYIGTTIGASFDHLYSGGWIGLYSGSVYIKINSAYNGVLQGPITFIRAHGEGLAGTGNGVHLATSLGSDITMNAVRILHANMSTPDYFVYGDDHIIAQNCIFDSVLPDAISVYKANKTDFGQSSVGGVAVVRNTHTPLIYDYWAGNIPKQLTDDSATPSVAGGNIFYSLNTNPTTITDFTNGTAGQVIYIVFYNANATINTNANIKLAATFNSANTYTLTLMHEGNRWYEIARKVADA